MTGRRVPGGCGRVCVHFGVGPVAARIEHRPDQQQQRCVSLVVTNGTNSAKYNIFGREFLDTNHAWTLLTNGGTGITNFTIPIGRRHFGIL
jgi:hypothetical protein